MADLLLALVPSLILGSMSILLMYFGGTDRQKITGLLLGGFITSTIALPFLEPTWTPLSFAVSFISGVLLGWGLFDQTVCLRVLGVSRTMPISTGAQLLFMSLGGVILFGEWRGPGALPVGVVAIALLIAGVWMTSLEEKTVDVSGVAVSRNLDWGRGTRLLVTSTFGLVVYVLVVRWFDISGTDAMFPQAVGYLLTGFLLTSGMVDRYRPAHLQDSQPRWSVTTYKQVGTGMLWGLAVLILQISTARVGVAVGFTLSQLGVILSTLGGIVLLGEHRTKKEAWWTAIGVGLVVGGAIMAGVAKALDG